MTIHWRDQVRDPEVLPQFDQDTLDALEELTPFPEVPKFTPWVYADWLLQGEELGLLFREEVKHLLAGVRFKDWIPNFQV